MNDETPQRWLKEHPVVSTVLWLIGGYNTTVRVEEQSPNKALGGKLPHGKTSASKLGGKQSNGKLTWKDEHDGVIAEYINPNEQLRGEEGESPVPTDSSSAKLPQKETRRPAANEQMTRKTSLTSLTDTHRSDDSHSPAPMQEYDMYADDSDDYEDDTISPQWGWYVSVTPPHETYASRVRTNSS